MAPVNKVIPLTSGGTLILSMDSVNLFDAAEHERKLLDDIATAVRAYERQVKVVGDAGAKADKSADILEGKR